MLDFLEKQNYIKDNKSNVWVEAEFKSIEYSDGDDVENKIMEIVANADDRSVFSEELRKEISDWPTLYHFGSNRVNILRPFAEQLRGAKVLEIGAGCGAITRFLGECGAQVLALEGSFRRACIARSRTRDLNNVEVLAEKFSDFDCDAQFDYITLIGVLEYANLFTSGEFPAKAMLAQVRKMLKPHGKLIIAIENQIGLKYFAGAPEDHLGIVMYGLEGRYEKNQPETFGREVLSGYIEDAGFARGEFMAPFPDYKFPISIVTEAGAEHKKFNAGVLASEAAHHDPQLPNLLNFRQEAVWPILYKNGLTIDLSNSFLIVAHCSSDNEPAENILAYHYSTQRVEKFAKETLFVDNDNGDIELIYKAIQEKENNKTIGRKLIFKPEIRAKYVEGSSFLTKMQLVGTRDGWMPADISMVIDEYLNILSKHSEKEAVGIARKLDSQLPGSLFDATPQNIIEDQKGAFHLIDQEWELRESFDLGWLIFRTLLLYVQAIGRFGIAGDTHERTRVQFFSEVFEHLGMPVTLAELDAFAEKEAEVQSEVTGLTVDHHRNWWGDSFLPCRNISRQLIISGDELGRTNMHLNEYREQLIETQLQLVNVIAKIENAIGTSQELKKQLAESNNKLNDLETQVQFLISEQKGLISELADREIKLTDLYDGVSTRDNHLAKLNEEISTREGMLKVLNDSIAHRDEKLSELNNGISHRDEKLLELQAEISARDEKLKELQSLHYASQQALMAIRNSKIWRWTYVIHSMPFKLTQTLPKANHISEALKIGGGFLPTIKTAIRVLRKEGVDGIRWRLRNVEVLSRQGGHLQSVEKASLSALSYSTTGNGIEYSELIPYYIDPSLNEEAHTRSYDRPLTVVLIPHGDSLLEGGLDALSSMKSSSSLRVLVPKSLYQKSTKLKKSGFHKNIVCFEPGLYISDIFRDELVRASEETSNILYVQLKNDKDVASLHSLIGAGSHPGGSFEHCWNIVAEHNSAIVYESDYRVGIHDLSSNSLASVQGYLEQRPIGNLLDVEDASVRAVSILFASSKFFEKLDNCYSPFSKKIESPTGDLNSIDIFEYLLPNLLRKVLGRKLAVQQLENVEPSRYYEEQIDFLKQKLDGSIKVLCYYLPQFHYTEENDLWHGKNFTEWTKVKGSTPLFEGHYQQHIPHPDIGYYLLTSAEALKRQADQMKKAGVHGQVFYHYWFTGRMILEKPAQMLLANPDIDMPFCFCWANENWTRRWDGNEREILLGQTYSAEDALRFIEYLIPFFKDFRYIKVEGRPVLSIYRPSSIPDIEQYLEIWEAECEAAGLKRPYMVATLTRGAVDPNAFHMDAAVERVLHDWTDGAVPDMRGQLRPYDSLEGSVLSYEKVADFYSLQKDSKDFTYFRSIVPVWDNAARYGNRALVVHGSTPILFQNWFDELVKYTKNNLPEDRQFIFVNAWNEWAEGAHLEPDVHFGYAHLNAIGRVLSMQDAESEFVKEAVSRRKVRIKIANALSQSLEKNEMQRRKFSNSLLNSKLLSNFDVTWSASSILGDAPLHQFQEGVRADCVLVFKDACIFDAEVLEKLVSTALQLKTAVVPTIYGDRSYPLEGAFNTVSAEYQRAAPVVAYFGEASDYWPSGATLQSNAWVFHLPADKVDATLRNQSVVTTIIRLHKSANIGELANALYSLNAMRDCIVQPMISAQDLSDLQISEVQRLLSTLLWSEQYQPILHRYQSVDGATDLRSKMLNECLLQVKTRYAAFLDYDDLLYADGYSWLLSRMKQRRVAVAFGRVYSTKYESASGKLISRKKAFEYGFTFQEFVGCNHAPLHSFLLDIDQIDMSTLEYHDVQKYMEDYCLTLQIFNESNADWEALKLNQYIGDYLHSTDRSHTLALNDQNERKLLLEDEHYQQCESRIQFMRRRINPAVNALNKTV